MKTLILSATIYMISPLTFAAITCPAGSVAFEDAESGMWFCKDAPAGMKKAKKQAAAKAAAEPDTSEDLTIEPAAATGEPKKAKLSKIKHKPDDCLSGEEELRSLLNALGTKNAVGENVVWETPDLDKKGNPVKIKGIPKMVFFSVYGNPLKMKLEGKHKHLVMLDATICLDSEFTMEIPKLKVILTAGGQTQAASFTPKKGDLVFAQGKISSLATRSTKERKTLHIQQLANAGR